MLQPNVMGYINSLTKYPSTPNYITIGRNKQLTQNVKFDPDDGPVYCIEKIDGINTRIMFSYNRHTLLGTRDKLIYAYGDMISPEPEIAEQLMGIADKLSPLRSKHNLGNDPSVTTVIYGELIPKASIYRMFARADFELKHMWAKNAQAGAAERDKRGFTGFDRLSWIMSSLALDLQRAPVRTILSEVPEDIRTLRDLLRMYAVSQVDIARVSEGLILYQESTNKVAKLRSADVERYFK